MPKVPSVPGAPSREHQRSRASQIVARHAARSQLFLFHFEHRQRLDPPRSWLSGQVDGEPAPEFVAGVLREPKYQAFRNDLLVGSFHPGHRAQWTAHELCHALVGFAYRPGASLWFHALSAWLCELVPVALWYFFEEADLRRCARHQGSGPLFQTYCDDCERVALEGPRAMDRDADRKLREGRRFVDRELSAARRARSGGRPYGTRYATLDLAEDALAYVAGHGARLRAPEMERFTAQFFAPHQGLHDSLEALEARVIEVCAALCGGKAARPWRATRWDYAAQDVGYRLLSVRATCTGDVASGLDRAVDQLAAQRSEAGLAACIEAYRELFQDAARARGKRPHLPAPELLFAVGYDLPAGYGHAEAQLTAGVRSACPTTCAALGREGSETLRAFARADAPERAPIGRRFARFLRSQRPGPLADLAQLEAAITHAAPRDAWTFSLDPCEARDARVRLSRGVEIVPLDYAVAGATARSVRRAKRLAEPLALLVLRSQDHAIDVLEIARDDAQALARARHEAVARTALGIADETLDALLRARVLEPEAYADG